MERRRRMQDRRFRNLENVERVKILSSDRSRSGFRRIPPLFVPLLPRRPEFGRKAQLEKNSSEHPTRDHRSGSMNPVETSIHRRNYHACNLQKPRARKTDRSLSALTPNKSYPDAGRTRNPFIAAPVLPDKRPNTS